MLSLAENAPPEELVIDGEEYPVDTDYRTWIAVGELLKNVTKKNGDETWNKIQELVFGQQIYCDEAEALNAVTEFYAGYPTYSNGSFGGDDEREPLLSFVYDINYIILAIRNQSGIDISYNCPHFHWWLFLLEVKSLEKRHYISDVIGCRAYDGDDKSMLKLKAHYALPYEYTEEEKEQADELNKIFYNC